MLVGIMTDPHFAETSSILNIKAGYKYSARLDYLIDSYKWAYDLFKKKSVDIIVNGGDVFDSTTVNAREMSALNEALSYGGDIDEYCLLGNHGIETADKRFNSDSLLDGNRKIKLITNPTKISEELSLLPYLTSIISSEELSAISSKLLISHNDILGIDLGGGYQSESGLDPAELKKYFDIVLNGHYHSASKLIKSKVIQIGSMFGTGFGDDYSNSYPSIAIVNTDTKSITRYINPYAVVFLKISINHLGDLIKFLEDNPKVKSNPKCLRITTKDLEVRDEVRSHLETIESDYNILATRIISNIDSNSAEKEEYIETLADSTEVDTALLAYLSQEDDSKFPSSMKSIKDYISEYISGSKTAQKVGADK